MRKVVLQISVSLDGYLGGARGLTGDLTHWIVDAVSQAGTHIMGRVTYEEMAAYWPTSTGAFAPPMNDIPKVVFSQTLDKADWPTSQVARGDLGVEIACLKQQPGKDILAHGGARFARSLVRLGLVDEYRLIVYPVVLGTGERLFPDVPEAIDLTLVSARTFESGAVVLVYQPAGWNGEHVQRHTS